MSQQRLDWRFCSMIVALSTLMIVGCQGDGGPKDNESTKNSEAKGDQTSTTTQVAQKDDGPKSRPAIKTTRLQSGGSGPMTRPDALTMSESAAVSSVTSVLSDYASAEPTLVIWLLDGSSNARPLVNAVSGDLRAWYDNPEEIPKNLETVVATYHDDANFLLEFPSDKRMR